MLLKLSNIRLYQLNPKRTWREVEDVNLQDTWALIASCVSTFGKVLFEWLHHGKRFTNLKMYDISSELTVMLKGFLKTLQLEIESPSKCFCPECDVLRQRNTFYRNQLKRNHFRKEKDKKITILLYLNKGDYKITLTVKKKLRKHKCYTLEPNVSTSATIKSQLLIYFF